MSNEEEGEVFFEGRYTFQSPPSVDPYLIRLFARSGVVNNHVGIVRIWKGPFFDTNGLSNRKKQG